MTFTADTERTARKPYWCDICRGRIAPGTRYLSMAGKSMYGDFHAGRAHIDCKQLWGAAYADWGDPYDGMLWDLSEVFSESGDRPAVREALNYHRGHFPHAVNRLEYRLRHWLEDEP